MPRPDLAPEARALEASLIEHFDGHDLNLPPLPRVPEQILRQLRQKDCDFAKISDGIAEDPVAAMVVLRMANSPVYRARRKITSLQPAVTRLGVNALRTAMFQLSLRAATLQFKGADPKLASTIWNRSLAGAIITSRLSDLTRQNMDEAFLIGLLRDIGNILVLRAAANQQAIMHHAIASDAFEYLCFETHQELGELIADAWELPATIKALIADHHTTPGPDDPLRAQRLQLQLADMIASLLGYGAPAAYDIIHSVPATALGLSTRDDFESFLEKLPADVYEFAPPP